PIAISVRQPLLAALPVLGADQLADLHLHQLLHDPAQALTQKVDAVFLKQVANDLLSSHPLRLGHRGDSPLVNSLAGTDESERRGGRTSTRLRPTRSYTTLWDVTGHYDHGFGLIERFGLLELLDQLIEHSFKSLLSSGRIATLERIAHFAHASGWAESPLVALVDAELAFRAGAFARTEAIATRVAESLGPEHRLTSHAWWIAGQAAQLSFDDEKASHHFDQAQRSAQDDEGGTDALWGLTMTLVQAEEATLTEVL